MEILSVALLGQEVIVTGGFDGMTKVWGDVALQCPGYMGPNQV